MMEDDELVTTLSLVALQNAVENSGTVQKLEVPTEFFVTLKCI